MKWTHNFEHALNDAGNVIIELFKLPSVTATIKRRYSRVVFFHTAVAKA